MAADEKRTPEKSDQEKFLEEVRRRAEEAELRRLEDEDNESIDRPPPASPPPAGHSAPPPSARERPPEDPPPAERVPPRPPHEPPEARPSVPAADSAPPLARTPPPWVDEERSPDRVAHDQKIAVLRERLMIALDRKKIGKSEELLTELSGLDPNIPELVQFRARLEKLQRPKDHPASPEESQRPAPAAPAPKVRPSDDQVQKIPELLDRAHSAYEKEKYDLAIATLREVLQLEPDNDEAKRLEEQVRKAKEIAELILKEEQRYRREELGAGQERTAAPPPPPVSHDETEVWGTQTAASAPDDLDLAPTEAGPVAPPKPPLSERFASSVSRVKIPWKGILSVLVVAVAALAGYYIVSYITHAVAPPEATLLVVPPVTPVADSAKAFFVDGLAEDLIADLSIASRLRVINAPTAFALRSAGMGHPAKARSVGAGFYIQWDAAWMGDQLLLEMKLLDTLSMNPIWSSRRQTSLKDVTGLRTDLARQILRAMKIEPEDDELSRLQRVPTSNAEAYIAYLQGRAVMREIDFFTTDDAARYFQAAIASDSQFAEARSALGWTYVLEFERAAQPTSAMLNRALANVQQAVLLGWRSAETFRVWGMTEFYEMRGQRSLERMMIAAEMSPSDAETLRRLAIAHLTKAEYDAALKVAEQAVEDDPANPASHTTLAHVYHFLGQYVHTELGSNAEYRAAMQQAVVQYAAASRMVDDRSAYSAGLYAEALSYGKQPEEALTLLADRIARVRDSYVDLYRQARLQQAAGRPKTEWEAVLRRSEALIEQALRSDPNDALAASYRALVFTRLGQFKEADAAARMALRRGRQEPAVVYNVARMYALQQNPERALLAIREAMNLRFSIVDVLDMDFYVLRSHPGFLPAIAG
jgi:tetratricopeptide (TPR) repeat protein